MEKVDRLGWAAGFSFLTVDRRARLGVRVSEQEDLDRAARVVSSLGCEPGQKERDVDQLWSLRRGGMRGRGRRNFHLLYDDSAVLSRTLDEAKIWQEFEQYLMEVIEVTRGVEVFILRGAVVASESGKHFLLAGQSPPSEDHGLKVVVPFGRIVLSPEGEFRNLPRGSLAGVAFPTSNIEPATQAAYYALLHTVRVSEGRYAAPLLRKFSDNVPVADLSPR